MGETNQDSRKLSEADIEAIADALEKRIANNLFLNLGKGFFGLVKKAVVLLFGGVILYGMAKGMKP